MRFRRKRKVRLHVEGMQASLEGILVGIWADHYVLEVPAIVAREDATTSLQDGTYRRALVPKSRVLFLQEV